MNDSEDAKKKTSRRRFTKTAASALVALPVISSLSSCGQKPTPPSPPGSPSPQPSGSPRVPFERGINPPIIIDGGSLSISLDTEFKKEKETGNLPRPWKHTEKIEDSDPRYGAITGVRLMNEAGDRLRDDFPISAADSLELKIWLQTTNGDENDDGEVTYDSLPTEPQFVLTNTGAGRTFEIRYVEKIDSSDKLYKKRRPHRKYREGRLNGVFGKVFRIGKVQIIAGATNYVAEGDDVVEKGFRIVVFMLDA